MKCQIVDFLYCPKTSLRLNRCKIKIRWVKMFGSFLVQDIVVSQFIFSFSFSFFFLKKNNNNNIKKIKKLAGMMDINAY
jgi:hypothetical protein